jgi:hypothetical protein
MEPPEEPRKPVEGEYQEAARQDPRTSKLQRFFTKARKEVTELMYHETTVRPFSPDEYKDNWKAGVVHALQLFDQEMLTAAGWKKPKASTVLKSAAPGLEEVGTLGELFHQRPQTEKDALGVTMGKWRASYGNLSVNSLNRDVRYALDEALGIAKRFPVAIFRYLYEAAELMKKAGK